MKNKTKRHAAPADGLNGISLDTWCKLYDLAARVRALAPWQWMEETDVFGVADAAGGDTLFVSVMGMHGLYKAIALYLGAKELHRFQEIQRTDDDENTTDMILGIRQLHLSFGERRFLERSEKTMLDKLELQFTGKAVWPCFRSYRPGFIPWLIDAQDAQWLCMALGQLLDVAPHFREDPDLLSTEAHQGNYLVRTTGTSGTDAAWHDSFQPCPAPHTDVQFEIAQEIMDAVQATPASNMTVELDVFPSTMTIGEKGERLGRPYLMMAMDGATTRMLGIEQIATDGTIESMWKQVPATFLRIVIKSKRRPRHLAIRSAWLAQILKPVCGQMGIGIVRASRIPALRYARQRMEKMGC